uniref:Uncharacterized protein n=1 Tax=Trypanosoma brucei TaxID=5691 RepID=Q581G9_9TRYP|nr:hypothetical protein, unlikely [Trypanosoma brucei]
MGRDATLRLSVRKKRGWEESQIAKKSPGIFFFENVNHSGTICEVYSHPITPHANPSHE